MVTATIRQARQADTVQIVTINEAGRPGVFALSHKAIAEVLNHAPYFTVAELEDRVVGYLIGYTSADGCAGDEFAWFQARVPRFLYIDQLAVAPAVRRAGVGAHLYAHAAAHAQTLGIPALVCEVNLDPPNPASLRFHTRHGFREVGVLRVQDGRTVSLRHKELGGSGKPLFY